MRSSRRQSTADCALCQKQSSAEDETVDELESKSRLIPNITPLLSENRGGGLKRL